MKGPISSTDVRATGGLSGRSTSGTSQCKLFAGVTLLALTLAGAGLTAQEETIAIVGGTVHTLDGAPIENGTVVLSGGLITAVGSGIASPAGAQVVDATGLHVYPGMFNAFSQLGLQEINSLAETNDMAELGDFNPHLLAATAVHPASERFPVTRSNGVTHAVSAPGATAGGIGGQASVIHLEGWTVEEMLISSSVGFVLSWPTLAAQRCGPFGCFGPTRPFAEARAEHEENVEKMRGWFADARRYAQAVEGGARPPRDLRLEALGAALRGELPLLVLADAPRDIRDAVAFAEEEGVKIVIVSGRDVAAVTDLLAEKDVPVLLRATQNVPAGPDDPYYAAFNPASALHAAGVRFAMTGLGSAGPNPPSRTLPYEAANAVPFGLPEEEALRAITRYPAEILGLGDRLGTIAEGKIGNVIVTDGDPLQIRTQVVAVFIAGAQSDLDNKHKELWERYRARR